MIYPFQLHIGHIRYSTVHNIHNLAELGIRYFLPFSLFANPLLQCSYLLSLLRYFSEICNTPFAIRYSLFAIRYSLLPLNSVMGFI
jgi:hypothetical protein